MRYGEKKKEENDRIQQPPRNERMNERTSAHGVGKINIILNFYSRYLWIAHSRDIFIP